MILDARTLQSSPESRARAGYDGHKRRKGSKTHIAVDTLGYLLSLRVTPANEQERGQVAALAEEVQEITGRSVELVYVDQGYTGDEPAEDAAEHGIQLEVVKHPEAKWASFSCFADGSSSAPSRGRLASADWLGITNDCRRRSPGYTSSPLPSSCSHVLYPCS